MKVFITVLLSLFLFNNLQAQSLKYSYYDPFTGNKVKEKFNVNSKGQKHGEYIKYDDRGLKAVEIHFKNGRPHGVAKEYALPLVGYPGDERVKKVANYVNGNQHGKTSYYVYIKDGKENIKEGKKVLQREEYYENGEKVREIAYFIDGSKEVDAYLINGKQSKWYDNGQLAVELHVEGGVFNGSWKEWYTNGQISVEGQKKSGKWFGEKREWHPDGSLKSILNFSEGDMYGEIYEGRQQYFDSLGNKTKEYYYSPLKDFKQTVEVKKFYSNGKLMSEYSMVKEGRKNPQASFLPDYKDYHENGNIAEKGQLTKDGYKTGVVVRYNSDGTKEGEYEYDNGNKIGEWTIYYDSSWNEVPSKNAAAYIREITFNKEGRPVEKELVKDYYLNGEKQFEGYLYSIDPDVKSGSCKFYYENGQKQMEGTYNAYTFRGDMYDRPTGKFISYHKNGMVSETGNYKLFERPNGEVVSHKDGDWFYYNKNGEIDSVEVFEEKHGETIIVSTLNKEQAQERERQRKELEAKKKKYQKLITQGDSLMTNFLFTKAREKYELALDVFPDNPEPRQSAQLASEKHNNLVESTKTLCDSVANRVQRTYVGTNSLLSSFADKKVKKVEKKKLYEGFEQVLEHYKNKVSHDKSSEEINEINKRLLLLEKRMLKFRNDETKDLEKSIRKEDNVHEIIDLLKLEDK